MHQRRCQIVADPAFFPPPDPPSPPPSFPCTNTNERTLSKKKKQVERSPKKKKFARVDEDELTQLRLKKKFLGGKYEKDGWTSHDDESNAPMLLHFIFFFFFFFFRAILPLKFIFIFFTSNKNPFRHEGWKKI